MRHGAVIPLVYNVTRWDTTQGSEGIGAAGTSRTSRRPPSRGGRGISGPMNGFCKGNLPGRVLGGREVPAPSGKASTGGFSGWGQLFPHRTMRHADPSPALHAGSTLPLPSPAAHPPTHPRFQDPARLSQRGGKEQTAPGDALASSRCPRWPPEPLQQQPAPLGPLFFPP